MAAIQMIRMKYQDLFYRKRKKKKEKKKVNGVKGLIFKERDLITKHAYLILTVNLGFTGVYIIFLISVQKHRLWVLVRTASAGRF